MCLWEPVDVYGKSKEIYSAPKVFDGVPEKSVASWMALIVGCVGGFVEAKKVFDTVPEKNVESYNAMISGMIKTGDLVSARNIFDAMPKKDVVSFTIMIDWYAKVGDMASARFLFKQAPEKDIIAWSLLVTGYAQNGQPNVAIIKIFTEMAATGIKPDEFIMTSMISACSRVGCLKLAKCVDSYLSQSAIDLGQPYVVAALIDMNAKCGNMKRATKLFDNMRKRNVISYCSMIQGLSIHGQGTEAVRLFNRMLSEAMIRDEAAFTVILNACSMAGLVEEGWRYFETTKNENSIIPLPEHYACMVDFLSRKGQLKAAYELVKKMPGEPHAGCCGALLVGCKLYGDVELGEVVADRLLELEPLNAANYVLLSNIYAASE